MLGQNIRRYNVSESNSFCTILTQNYYSLPNSPTAKMYKIVLLAFLICLVGFKLEASAAPAPIIIETSAIAPTETENNAGERVERAVQPKTTSIYRPVCWGFAGVCG